MCLCFEKKTEIKNYGHLDEKDITNNKCFYKTVKPLLSDKSMNSCKNHFNKNGALINSESKTAEMLNNFFSNIVKNLKIPEYENLSESPFSKC